MKEDNKIDARNRKSTELISLVNKIIDNCYFCSSLLSRPRDSPPAVREESPQNPNPGSSQSGRPVSK